jgi:hypothetical protein
MQNNFGYGNQWSTMGGNGDIVAMVTSWYQRFLGREPDQGANDWVQRLQNGTPEQSVLAGILGSDEYYNRSGSNVEGFITALFRDLLNREPSPQELANLMQQSYSNNREGIAYEVIPQM